MELLIRVVLFLVACFAICAVSAAVREEEWNGIFRRTLRSFLLTSVVILALSTAIAVIHAFV